MAVSKLNKGELIVKGRCNGMGDLTPVGSYIRIVYSNDLGDYGLTISEGAADVLIDELRAALQTKQPWDEARDGVF